jgi:tetratricopeptide (TPR) repeat protein
MTESTCLHIQDRESGPIRVVELAWISVRIGRAAHCEVRLTGPDLPEEICRLQRRGQSWRLLPVATDSPVFLEGRRLGNPCVLPFGVPFRAGEYCFTLCHDRTSEPDWELYAGPAPPREAAVEKPPVAEVEPDPSPVLQSVPVPPTPLRRIVAEPLIVEKRPDVKAWDSPPPLLARERWETRWKALGAQVEARAERKRKTPEISRPAYQSDLEPIPLRAAQVPLIQVPAIPKPSPEPPRERVARHAPVPISISPTEDENVQPALEPIVIDELSSPEFEPQTVVELRDERPFILAEESSSSEPSADVAPDDPVLEVPVVLAEESSSNEPSADVAPDDPVLEVPVVLAEESSSSEPSADVAPDDPVLEVPVVLAEESWASVSPAYPVPDNSALEVPLILAEELPVSEHFSAAVADDPALEVPVVLAEESATSVRSAPIIRDDPGYELPLTQAPAYGRDLEWPSAKDILATYRAAGPGRLPVKGGKRATKKINRSSVMPTVEYVPAQWNPPTSVAGPLVTLFILAAGLLGCSLSWSWAQDSYTASIVIDRLLAGDRAVQRTSLPESVQPPAGGWTTSTSAHLANWAIFLGRIAAEENQPPAETVALLELALAASPINAQARFAMAQLEPADGTKSLSVHSMGLSRDGASLAWSARQLLAAGKKDEALNLFGRAISIAVPEKVSRSRVPRFSEDPGVRRYLLPGEEQVREIVVDLVSQNVWTFDEWSRVLPEDPIVLIATARLLRERGRSESETVLDLILKERAIPLDSAKVGSVTLAAYAEAFALRSRFRESGQLYRQAIDSIDEPTIRRSWWFNLADVSYQADDETERQAALRSATAVAFSDDITRRAIDLQRALVTRSTGVKAN